MEKINWEKLKKQTAKRNKQIFREYQKGKGTVSMSQLGKKYDLTRSRISYIIIAERKKLAGSDTIDKA